MSELQLIRRAFFQAVCVGGAGLATQRLFADEPRPRDQLREPLFRVSKAAGADPQGVARATAAHPLDPALDIAYKAMRHIQSDIADYTCTFVKRERIKDKLGDYEYMFAKVRNRRMEGDRLVVPFAIYLYFIKPDAVKGREVIFVEGANNGKMVAHEGGLKGSFLPTVWLKPDSALAMAGNRYPITEAGVETLVMRLIEKGQRDRKQDECQVEFRPSAKINGRVCTLLKVVHPVQRDHFDFHRAEIFVDNEYQVPVRYAAYVWPTTPGGEAPLLEEYTYLNMKLNVGLKDIDFDHTNPEYAFVNSKKKAS